jgi:hypothetical protein
MSAYPEISIRKTRISRKGAYQNEWRKRGKGNIP